MDSTRQDDQDLEENLIENEIVTFANRSQEKGVETLSTPFVGMIFETMERAKDYYTEYERQNGFLTRIRNTQRTLRGDGEPNICILVCGREVTHKKRTSKQDDSSKDVVTKRNTSTVKCGCRARMRVQMQDVGWVVSIFEDNHNHKAVTPCKRKYMKVNRKMPKVAKALTEAFQNENLPVGKVAAVLDGENMGFNERDCWNHLNSNKTKKTKEGDATAALEYFQKKMTENSQFFYAIQTDSEGRAVNFFWVDGRSRSQYKYFGDVVVFDTTYRTNVYQMPFGPFTGVNHHWQSIQFGCALLLNETEESFVWLFKTWLGAMGGRAPTSIITDQDKAMTPAIAKVFPKTQHRFCLWHVTKHFPEHLAHAYAKTPTIKNDMHDIMKTFREKDFEEKWDDMLLKYDLKGIDWLEQIYETRQKWGPAYNLDTFYAGMNTTGRSEGMNSFYKLYFTPHSTLHEFLGKYDKCCEKIAKAERVEDYETEHKNRIVDDDGCIINHAASLYTRSIYDKFRIEWKKAQVDYKVEGEQLGEEYDTYLIRSRNIADQNEWNVKFSFKTLEGSCECKKFEFMGIPCGHILKIFLRFDIDEIPKNFVHRRWMQGANKYRTEDGGELLTSAKDSRVLRLCHGSHLANQIVYECAEDDESFKMLVETLTTLSVNIAKHKASKESPIAPNTSSNMTAEETPGDIPQVVLINPNISQTKGRKRNMKRPSSTRIKGGLEEAQRKKYRQCKFCGKQAGHDKRNCPDNPNRKKNQGKRSQGDDLDEGMEDASGSEDPEMDTDLEDDNFEEL